MTDLNEMWQELERYQPFADKRGFGEAWKRMCEERTEKAAYAAAGGGVGCVEGCGGCVEGCGGGGVGCGVCGVGYGEGCEANGGGGVVAMRN